MGLKPWEFWKLTPREFVVLAEAYLKSEEKIDRRFALIACMIHNVNSKKKLKLDDFVPKKKEKQTSEQMLRVVEMMNAAFGGEDKR